MAAWEAPYFVSKHAVLSFSECLSLELQIEAPHVHVAAVLPGPVKTRIFEDLPVDDVAFFRALVEDVKAQHPVSRVYMLGHSNGGFMTLRLACEAPDVFDGFVAVSASTWDDPTRCGNGVAKPVLLVHGDEDGTIFYEGREGLYPGEAVTSAQRKEEQPART